MTNRSRAQSPPLSSRTTLSPSRSALYFLSLNSNGKWRTWYSNRLERMVNELDDLERRGLFTRREIADIVKQRRKFEYRLKRPSPLKQDFLAYIDYEKQLDALRLLRKKAGARELKEKGNKKMKKSISDFAGVSRIIEIYRLATNRFKGDIELWFQYLEFCGSKFPCFLGVLIKEVLAQLIRFHPKVPGVWMYAAAWEFDHNLNAAAARALMQSGLRACPTSEDLWVEYLRMELTYLNKLKARRVALGEDEGTLICDHRDVDEKQWRDENKELFLALDEKREDGDASDVQNEESMKTLDLFRKQEIFQKNQNIGTGLQNSKQLILKVYEEAIKTVPSVMMFNLYTKFLMDAIIHKNEETQSSGPFSTSDHTLDPISHMLDDAREVAEKLCNGKLSDSVQLQVLRRSIEIRSVAIKSPSPSKADLLSVFDLLKKILTEVAISEAETLWLMAFKFFANQRHYFDKLVEISLVSLAKDGGSDNVFSLSSAIVNFVLRDGIQCAREMYKRFLALPHPDYYSMEIKMGTSETATAVYWHARKTLKDNVALLPSPELRWISVHTNHIQF
ncbi:hypothetical protein F0562_014351 [Nyssa sinensis]|uniref:U3 small nucleolar RNA-associated protein 6 N-terminal domain-containing protein n=1 Tax=Nyssa sinensis TaxID=561372 RepID=A0A5J4ZN73_9ASTE|nr:hypothetical protein F0562_014351 [Nyssa sinensis]